MVWRKKTINAERVSANAAGGSKAPETQMADARNFQPGSKLSGEMQFEHKPSILGENDEGFDAGPADDTLMDGDFLQPR